MKNAAMDDNEHDDNSSGGVREPRKPRPASDSGGAEVELEREADSLLCLAKSE